MLGSPYPSHFRDIEQADNEMNVSLDAQVSGVTAAATMQVQVGSHICCTNTRPSAMDDTEIVSEAAAGAELTVKKRPKKVIRPRQGGMDGEFSRMLSNECLPGVTVDQVLGLNSKGQQIKLEPSKLQMDYVAIDTRALHGVRPSEDRRDLSEVGKLVSQTLVRLDINSKSDVGEARSWLKYAKDPVTGAITSVPAPQYFSGLTCAGGTRARTSMHGVNFPIPAGDNSLLYNPIKTKRILCDKSQSCSLGELERPFSDNFTAQVRGAAGTNSRGLPNTSMDTMHMICKLFGWKSGMNADDCQNKYYITPCNQPKNSIVPTIGLQSKLPCFQSDSVGKSRFNSKLKVSTADIPIADVYAVYDAMETAAEEEWRTKLVSRDMREVGNLIEMLKLRHPEAKVFDKDEANIPRALEFAASCVLPTDQDVTVDLAGSPHILNLESKFEEMGDIIAEKTIGHNGFKTEVREILDGLQYTIMVYDKLCETYQQSGKSKERTLDSKVHRLVNPSTTGLKKRFAHQEYQNHGLTRVEGTFIGSGWTECLKNEIIERYVAVVRTGLVTKSIHDHLADTELFLGPVIALYLPEVHTLKTKALRNINPKARKDARDKINRVPEGAVSYWKTGTTGKRIGHVIASEVNLGKGSNGFSKMMSSLAFESPCSLDVQLYSVVDGFEEYMQGGTPTIFLRRLILEKKAVTEQFNSLSMLVSANVCKGAGPKAETDIAAACGVIPYLMSHLKLAVQKEDPTFQNTGLYLQHKGTASVTPAAVDGRTFFGPGSLQNLPETYVNVTMVEDRKGLIGKPSKTKKSFMAFKYQGEKIRFPDQYQELLRDYHQSKKLNQNSDNDNDIIRVRFSASNGFEYEILSASPLQTSLVVCQQGKAKCDRDLPVQAEPMKILNIHRTKRFKGHNFEIELESHGRFMGPPTSTKNLIELMKLRGDIGHHIWQDKNDQQSRVDLSSKGYFLGHTTSMHGPVRGGKGRDEEWIQFIKDDGRGKREVVLESEGTKRAYKRGQEAMNSEKESIEPHPSKRKKLSSS